MDLPAQLEVETFLLVICPINRKQSILIAKIFFEINIDIIEQKYFLDQAGISYVEAWTAADTERACTAWNLYIVAKRQAQTPKRPVADILIGGFAANRSGLVTRNTRDFKRWYPSLKIIEPSAKMP